jgi:2-haloacid dehalogenase
MSGAMHAIDTIVFDLGGVLVDWNPRYLYRKLIKDDCEVERFLAEVCHGGWNEKQDEGRTFAEAIAELVAVHPEKKDLIQAYFDRWPEMIGGAFDETVAVLRDLHAGERYRLFALSNWSVETFPHALSRFDFFAYFENILLSGEEKMMKPDARFFALLSSRHGVQPNRTIFIDDVEKNVNAARNLGFHTIRFTDQFKLRDQLAEMGVTVK